MAKNEWPRTGLDERLVELDLNDLRFDLDGSRLRVYIPSRPLPFEQLAELVKEAEPDLSKLDRDSLMDQLSRVWERNSVMRFLEERTR